MESQNPGFFEETGVLILGQEAQLKCAPQLFAVVDDLFERRR